MGGTPCLDLRPSCYKYDLKEYRDWKYWKGKQTNLHKIIEWAYRRNQKSWNRFLIITITKQLNVVQTKINKMFNFRCSAFVESVKREQSTGMYKYTWKIRTSQ